MGWFNVGHPVDHHPTLEYPFYSTLSIPISPSPEEHPPVGQSKRNALCTTKWLTGQIEPHRPSRHYGTQEKQHPGEAGPRTGQSWLTSTRYLRAEGTADPKPTLSFQTRKPGTTGKKPSLSSVRSVSATSIRREPSTDDAAAASRPASPAVAERDSIDVTDRPGPHAAAEKAQHQLDEGKKRKRPELDVDDKAWEGVRRQAFKEMGGMKPSEPQPQFQSYHSTPWLVLLRYPGSRGHSADDSSCRS